MKLTINIDDSMNVTVTRPCDACEVDVPTNEHCGDGPQYLCPDCYGLGAKLPEDMDQKYIHDWLIFLYEDNPLECGPIAIHKDVVDPNCIKAADCSSPDPDDDISRFGPGTSAHTLNSFADMHLDINDVWLLVDEGFITWEGATLIFKTQGGAA
tara:strand:+ start:119 stop:580 length:462 start_codon:yes stop_codon:yes gene_type:complete